MKKENLIIRLFYIKINLINKANFISWEVNLKNEMIAIIFLSLGH